LFNTDEAYWREREVSEKKGRRERGKGKGWRVSNVVRLLFFPTAATNQQKELTKKKGKKREDVVTSTAPLSLPISPSIPSNVQMVQFVLVRKEVTCVCTNVLLKRGVQAA
jgi:hypothetical protein